LNELIGLTGERGNVFGLRNAVFAVAGDAHLRLFLAGGKIGGQSRNDG